MNIIYLILGIVIGFFIGWLMVKSKFSANQLSIAQLTDDLQKQMDQKHIEYQVESEKTRSLNQQLTELKLEITEERSKVSQLNASLSTRNAEYNGLNEKLTLQKQDIENLQKKFTEQFDNLANKIFEEKTQKFTQQNRENLDQVLKPLNDKLKDFEKKVEDTYIKNVKDRTDLQVEIKKLYELNSKISEDANNLTKALKGDVKKQGNWGEVVLERILESSGLEKDREYKTQVSIEGENGTRYLPDVIIYLPENKHIIIDSKVSLVAYENLVNAIEQGDQERFMKDHLRSIKSHIKELSDKQYYKLDGMNSPEYVLMFLPIESSFSIAVREDTELFNFAWNNKIVIVSPSTLIATLLTISSIWRQENQTRNALEIARKSGDLYDKFVGLMEDLVDLGNKLKATQKVYESSMNKLVDGKGNLIKRTEELKSLGAKASKTIPSNLLDRATNQPELSE